MPLKTSYSTIEEAVEIAAGLAPGLRERIPMAEELRRLPEENVRELLDSGLIALENPRRWGGPELSLDALIEVCAALSEGCPSTSWVYALWGAHMWLIGQYPEHVQEQVFTNPDSLISSVVNTTGTPEIVEGGYTWSGRGFFSSGVDHCNWLIAAVEVHPEGAQPDRRWFLIPRSDFEIIDDWYTVGLKATGSKTVELKDVFIPEDHCIRQQDLSQGTAHGASLHNSPLYCAAMDFTFSLPLAGPEVGIARSVIKTFEERCRTRIASPNPRQANNQLASLIRLAEAGAQVDAARALLLEDARRFCNMPAADATELDKFKCRRDVAFATQLCRKAANSIFEAAGGSNIYDSSDMQRLWRDSNVAAAHNGLMWDHHGLAYGRLSVGLEPMGQSAP
jgi:alkylation response protein AidB-like acyl-CoA dehydrogenase